MDIYGALIDNHELDNFKDLPLYLMYTFKNEIIDKEGIDPKNPKIIVFSKIMKIVLEHLIATGNYETIMKVHKQITVWYLGRNIGEII